MPKPKPDQVIRYEVVLGSTERQVLKDIRSAYVFNRVSAPMVDLAEDVLTSPRALATFLTFLGMFYDIPYFPDFQDLSESLSNSKLEKPKQKQPQREQTALRLHHSEKRSTTFATPIFLGD